VGKILAGRAQRRLFRYHALADPTNVGQAVWEGRARRLVEQSPGQCALCLSQQASLLALTNALVFRAQFERL
jgi:hypothetical protein